MIRLYSPSDIIYIQKKHGLRPSKSLGQNYLADRNVTEKIVQAAGIGENDIVVEIGPGLGALTVALAEKAARVIAVELDTRLIPALEENILGYGNVTIVNDDILKTDIKTLVDGVGGGGNVKIVGNLPYYITTSIIAKLLEENTTAKSMTFMIQKEVALRLCAESGVREGGAVTILVRYHSEPSIAFYVPKDVFVPKPKVDSAVIRLDMLAKKPVSPLSEKLFFAVVKAGFGQRRKTLLNALTGLDGHSKAEVGSALDAAGVDPGRRAETLNLQEFAAVADAFYREISV